MPKKRVLVIEDEPSIADNIVYALETEGFDVCWRATARDGHLRFEEGGVDLIILDVGLPDRSGFDLCRDLRKSSDVPIIFLTARADEIDRVVGLELGGDDYVVKPFSPRELSARVKAILRRSSREDPGAASNETSDPFDIDTERLEIRYRGHRLDLSRYEYRLLAILVESPGRVYSRDQLMNRAWEDPGASMERTVDAHIKSLRSKLRVIDTEDEPIRTHRGLGYSLKDYR